MYALTLSPEPRVVSDHPQPARRSGEARLRMRVSGVCDTDLQLSRGYMGFQGVPGHEFVAEVLEADTPALVGRRVVGDINAGCGVCADCLSKTLAGHHCKERSVLGILGRDGAFAEELCLPERCLALVPDGVTDDQAVFAEPLAAALHVLDELQALGFALPGAHVQQQVEAGEHTASQSPPFTRPHGAISTEQPVLVLGDGKLGLLIAAALAASGAPTLLVGHHPSKLSLATRMHRGGSLRCCLESELPAGLGVPMVVEATGSEAGLSRALSLANPRGTIVLKTTVAGPLSVDLSPVVINELRLVGSRCGDMARALSTLAGGALDPAPMIQARYPLSQADSALSHAARRGSLKVLIDGAK